MELRRPKEEHRSRATFFDDLDEDAALVITTNQGGVDVLRFVELLVTLVQVVVLEREWTGCFAIGQLHNGIKDCFKGHRVHASSNFAPVVVLVTGIVGAYFKEGILTVDTHREGAFDVRAGVATDHQRRTHGKP